MNIPYLQTCIINIVLHSYCVYIVLFTLWCRNNKRDFLNKDHCQAQFLTHFVKESMFTVKNAFQFVFYGKIRHSQVFF